MRHDTVAIGDIDLASTLVPLTALPSDPTVQLEPGRFARATWTPDGPGSIVVTWTRGGPSAQVTTSGDGGPWLRERAPQLLGCHDDVTGFQPTDRPLAALWRRRSGDRIARTATLWNDLAWFVLQQRVTRAEAAHCWSRLVRDLGTPAPGVDVLTIPPDPITVARRDYSHFHRYGIERRRATHLISAARAALRLHGLVERPIAEALVPLRGVHGIGPWTASCLAGHTWGDRDTVIVGDDGIPSMVAWLLAGERRADDQRLLDLLEPYRPHRYRVIKLAFAAGLRPPRRAPRAPRHDIRGR